MRYAGIDLDPKDGTLRIQTSYHTTAGVNFSDQVFFLNISDSIEKIGQQALEALSYYRIGVPHPNREEMTKDHKEWLARMKIKSWPSYARNIKIISLSEDENHITITPYKNSMPKEGFDGIQEKSRTLSDTSPSVVGQAILDAFEDCE